MDRNANQPEPSLDDTTDFVHEKLFELEQRSEILEGRVTSLFNLVRALNRSMTDTTRGTEES